MVDDSLSRDSFRIRRKLENRFSISWKKRFWTRPFDRVILNGEPLPTGFVSKHDIEAIISPEVTAKAGTHLGSLKCESESFPESHRAHLVVGFKQ